MPITHFCYRPVTIGAALDPLIYVSPVAMAETTESALPH